MSQEFKLPDLGGKDDSCDVVGLFCSAGDTVSEGAPLIEVETDKSVIEIPAEVDMTIVEVRVAVGDHINVGQVILVVSSDEKKKPAAKKAPVAALKKPAAVEAPVIPVAATVPVVPVTPPPAKNRSPNGPVAAAPSVRREARELGVDINRVTGTGPRGRLSISDVRAFVKQGNINGTSATAGVFPGHVDLPDFSQFGQVERQKMNGVRRMTARHLAATWNTVPQVTQFDHADITDLERLRKHFAPRVAKDNGGKLTITAIMLKVVASALKVFPNFNSAVDMGSEEIVLKKYINIGLAVETPRGLLVPVVRGVDGKNITQLAADLAAISAKARTGKSTPEDMSGGNFTISNLGGIGGIGFSPIVNHPEVAILGISRGSMEAKYIDGEFVPRLMLPLSLSYDHRVIDGAEGARFLRWVCEALEEPMLLTLEG